MANVNEKDTKKGVKKESESDIELVYGDNKSINQKKKCLFCRCSFFRKRVLRLVVREYLLYVTILLIRLQILEGSVILEKKQIVNYLKLNKNQRGFYPSQDDFASISKEACKKPEMRNNRIDRIERDDEPNRLERFRRYFVRSLDIFRRNTRNEDENDSGINDYGIIDSFLFRLAKILDIEIRSLEACIDHVITSYDEILLDINFQKLTRASSRSEEAIECMIMDIFWQPKALTTLEKKINQHDNSKHDSGNDDSWFEAVDRGCVVPFYSSAHASLFGNRSIDRSSKSLLNRCVHEIEENSLNAFSWYLDEYFYHDFVCPRNTCSYEKYLNCQILQKILNPKVIVDKTNPLELGIPFAHVITLNFYSYHEYVRNYMRDIHLLSNSIIRINKNIPFIVRSLNPITGTHIFHIVYKRNYSTLPTYENLFKGLVLLRNAMLRLKLKDLAMCKIGCYCERLDFDKVIRMTEFVFLNTDINVRIGLNLTKCCQSKSRPVKYDHDEYVDLHSERINRYFSCDTHDISKTDVHSIDED